MPALSSFRRAIRCIRSKANRTHYSVCKNNQEDSFGSLETVGNLTVGKGIDEILSKKIRLGRQTCCISCKTILQNC